MLQCVKRTPHRAYLTRATHANFLVCTWLKMIALCCSLVFLKSHSISPMFRGTLLDTPFSSSFCTLCPTHAPSPTASPSLLCRLASPPTATLQRGLCFGRLAKQSPLTDYEPMSLMEVSSELTSEKRQSPHESRRSRDASDMLDTTDVGSKC